MILMQGKGVSQGVTKGRLYFYSSTDSVVVKVENQDVEEEKRRIAAAQEKSIRQLDALAEKAREEAGDESALLFETHAMFVEDDDYVEAIMDMLEEESCNAEYAVMVAGNQFSDMFANMDDEYLKARASDIRDVTRRLVNNLLGVAEGGIDSDEPVILAARDLAPSETLQLDKTKILGFVTREGSSNSHTAILARTMGIPAICGMGEALKADYDGRVAYIDGETGQLVLDPDEITLMGLQEKYKKQQEMKALLETMKGQEDVTLDGRKLMVYCNIGSPEDVAAVKANDGQGIGLFRSEFLYLAAEDYPSEEEQFQAYKPVASAMDGRRVVIRTLDIGADKQVGYTLACDRQCNDLGKFFDPHHPGVLRAIKFAADAAHKEGRWIGICGELAGDLSLLPTFLAIGIDELSVSPSMVLPLRAAIRESIAKTCTLERLES